MSIMDWAVIYKLYSGVKRCECFFSEDTAFTKDKEVHKCAIADTMAGHTLLTPAHVLRGSMELWRRNPAYSTWNIEHWHTAQWHTEQWHTAQWHTAHVLRGSVRFQPRPHYSGQPVRPLLFWRTAHPRCIVHDTRLLFLAQSKTSKCVQSIG